MGQWKGRAVPVSDERAVLENNGWTSPHKLIHDADQLRDLIDQAVLPAEHIVVAQDLMQVASQLENEGTPGPEGLYRLNSTQLQQLDNFYNRAHYAEPALSLAPRRA